MNDTNENLRKEIEKAKTRTKELKETKTPIELAEENIDLQEKLAAATVEKYEAEIDYAERSCG